ncbi:MAG TPA: AMP-binding protein [Solirubrobacteraceae bacterium]|nr:AMP-binding protein [Solirubrobacteraceae bacterium]
MPFWIHAAAGKHPDRIALEGLERRLTYAELAAAAVDAARALRRLGPEPGSRVALALPPGEDFVIAWHACVLTGHPPVPIDLRLRADEQEQRLAGATLAIREPLTGGGPTTAGSACDGDPVVAVMHTSGTTATPKPVELTQSNFLASALGSAAALGLDQAERWLCPMPLTHVGGLSIPVRSAIYATTAVLHGRFETEAVLDELMDPGRRITVVSLVPTMLARLLDAGLSRPPTLRWALLGGGPIAPALIERAAAAGVPVAPTYGMTEACSQIATFGRPLHGVEVIVADDGELRVRGPIVSTGALSADGWLHTGDLGRFDDHGRLEITGRKADTIVTGGENVAPVEVESVLLSHPAVADAAVHPRADPEWGEAVVATVVLRDGSVVEADELRTFCAERLARFKVPKSIAFAPALPRTTSGKLVRRELV